MVFLIALVLYFQFYLFKLQSKLLSVVEGNVEIECGFYNILYMYIYTNKILNKYLVL